MTVNNAVASANKELINPETMGKPSGFSHGVKSGNTVYLGGQTALDKDMKIVPGGIVEQFRQAFWNVLETLKTAGGEPGDLVSVTIYLTDVDDYLANGREIGKVWREMAGSDYPALAGIGVSRLWQKEALIEIQGVAEIANA